METPNFNGTYLFADDLAALLQNSKTRLEFVFIATCHSQFAAQIFHNAGALHVIGIKEQHTV